MTEERREFEVVVEDSDVGACDIPPSMVVGPKTPGAPPVVSYACPCKKCVARETRAYRLPVTCYCCGHRWTGEMRRGDRRSLMVACPLCGVRSTVSWGRASEVEQP